MASCSVRKSMTKLSDLTTLIITEINRAIAALGGTAMPTTPAEARCAVRAVGANMDLRLMVDSWKDALDGEQILELLRNRNAGRPAFATTCAQPEALLRYAETDGAYDGQLCRC